MLSTQQFLSIFITGVSCNSICYGADETEDWPEAKTKVL